MKAATAVGTATTVGAATTVECARTVTAGAATAVDCARTVAAEAATAIAAPRTAPIGVPWAISVTRSEAVSPTVVTGAAIIAASASVIAAPVAAKPWPSTNKHSTYKVVRPVVAVRRAGIRVIAVVSISANGRSAIRTIHRANSNTHPDLRLRVARTHQQNAQ